MESQTTFISLFLLSLLSSFLSTASVDPQFGLCAPQICGNVTNISYPFWINGQQSSQCGFPQFKLDYEDNKPFLQTPNGALLIRDIFYANNTILVAPGSRSSANDGCPIHGNFTFTLTPFTVSPVNKELFLLYNCTKSPPSDYYRVPCANYTISSFLVGNNSSPEQFPLSDTCKTVVTPVVGFPGAKASDYVRLLNDGFLLEWSAADCSECTASDGQCGYNGDTDSFMCICNDNPTNSRSCSAVDAAGMFYAAGRRNTKKIAIGVTAGVSSIVMSFLVVFLCACRAKVYRNKIIFWHKHKRSAQGLDSFLEKYGSISPKRYTYSDVKKMTKSFATELGSGGYGVVYKGKLHDGHPIAVKVLNNTKGNGEEFVNEVASIGRTSHVNVVSLLGYCYEGSKRALIYEFMPNGSLEKFIYAERSVTTPLGWERLFNIAVGIARGLAYLHRDCNTRILHFDIKPHNILLDQVFCPKISDFGLAKLCPPQKSIISMSGARGTIGYIAPEVFSRHFGFISSKSDVYSYGMMVLEIVGGRKNANAGADNTSEIYFPHWIYEHFDRDGDLELCGVTNEHEEIARKMILVGLWCIQTAPGNRPSMSRVLEMLEGSISSLEMPPKPYLSSPVRSYTSSASVTIS